MYRCLVFSVLLVVSEAQWLGRTAFGFGGGFAPPALGYAAAAGNRGYTLTSSIDGVGNALGSRRRFGPMLGFQAPNELMDRTGCFRGFCKNFGVCTEFPAVSCLCPTGFTGRRCEIPQGTRALAMSGNAAPHNRFDCPDTPDPGARGRPMINDCAMQLERVKGEGIWHYPHKRYNNLYVQCDQSGGCRTRTCQPGFEFNAPALTCMPCNREGAPGCVASQNAVRAVSASPASAVVPSVPVAAPAAAAAPVAALGAMGPGIGALPFSRYALPWTG